MSELKEKSQIAKHLPLIVGLTFLAIFLGAFIFPEKLWGFHHIAFLTPLVGFGFLVLAFFIIGVTSIKSMRERLRIRLPSKWWFALILALCAGWFFRSFPIHDDFYGDSPRHQSLWEIG